MLSISRLLALAGGVAATVFYAGVAESGGEFGVYSSTATKGTGLPGTFGVTYQFINQATVKTFVGQGVNTFRVAFLLERMCPVATGLGAMFNETHYGYYADAINYITGLGAYAILDPHNYMRYNDPSQQPATGSIIGNTADPNAATTAQFGAFWGELAGRFAANPRVIFGLMNEPHDMSTQLIVQNNQAAINAIRAAGAEQLIIAPGNGYTGGHSWNQSTCANCDPSSQWLNTLTDPAGNLALDIHEYLDVDFSGGHSACTQDYASNLSYLTAWLKQNNLKAIISEFGGDNGTSTNCPQLLSNAISYMAQNPEYIGWTAWAAGPFWGTSSPCCTDGQQFGSLEPGSTAAGGGPSLYTTVWQPIIEPLLPKTLQTYGISSVNGPGGAGGGGGGSSSSSSSSSTPTSTSTTKSTTSTTSTVAPTGTGTVAQYGQCGGVAWTGGTVCKSPYTCKYSNPYYSQCL